MSFLAGDKIRLEITTYDLKGDENAPETITVSVYKSDSTKLLDAAEPILMADTKSCYYYDWEIPADISEKIELTVLFEWTGPHRKKKEITVVPIVE